MLSFRRFFSGLSSAILKTVGLKHGVEIKEKVVNDTIIPYFETKRENVIIPPTTTDPDTISNMIKQTQNEDLYDDIPDTTALGDKVDESRYEDLPDYYGGAIYPATTRPNIDAIRYWVVNVKLRGMNDADLLAEIYGTDPQPHDKSKGVSNRFNDMVDSIAYRISRKIWYVGRRSSGMTDYQWNELTRFMRPPEGSYGANDKWKVFKYDTDYVYRSGVVE